MTVKSKNSRFDNKVQNFRLGHEEDLHTCRVFGHEEHLDEEELPVMRRRLTARGGGALVQNQPLVLVRNGL